MTKLNGAQKQKDSSNLKNPDSLQALTEAAQVAQEVIWSLENLPSIPMEELLKSGRVIKGLKSISKTLGITTPTCYRYLTEGILPAWKIGTTWYSSPKLLSLAFSYNQINITRTPREGKRIQYVIIPIERTSSSSFHCPVCNYRGASLHD